jgi:hypothetical protein
MKIMLLAFLATAIIAVGSSFVLKQVGFSSQDRTVSPSVRLDD